MKYFLKHFPAAMLVLGMILAAVPAARADTTCLNQSLSGSTVNGNLIVPPGATCTLIGVTVTGNVQVQLNATLNISSGPGGAPETTIGGNLLVGTGATLDAFSSLPLATTVNGNVSADHCTSFIMFPVKVGGNVTIQNCAQFGAVGAGAQISGNFLCSNNSGESPAPGEPNAACGLFFAIVNGNVQVNDNQGTSTVGGNQIGGNLQCQGNASITDLGSNGGSFGPSTVGGHKEGQCAGL
jgi:hypothetical protein